MLLLSKEMIPKVNGKLRSETLLYGLSKYATVAVTLVTTAVLSRLLTPQEYGVVSLITVFTAFFSVIADLGLGTAVIQNKALEKKEIDDIYSVSVYFSMALALLFALLGFPISLFYRDRVYRKICALLSFSVFFNAMNAIPNALLMKQKRFKLVGIRLITVALAIGAISIAMAYMGMSYYALIGQSVFQAAAIFAWNWWNTRPTFHIKPRMASVQKVKAFSTYQFLYNVVNYFARNLDNLLIGRVMGSTSLAYYDKGYKLMMYPVQNLTYVLNPILHPVLSEHQEDRRYIYDAYMKVVRVLSTLGVLISVICFWCSEEIVILFFGEQWQASVPVFRMLSLSVWPQMVASSAGSIYQSTGNTRLMLKSGIVHFSTTIVMIILGVLSGDLIVLAKFVSVSLYMRFVIDYIFLIVRNFRYSFGEFLFSFRKEALAAAAMMLVMLLMNEKIQGGLWMRLLIKGGIAGFVGVAVLACTGELRMIRTMFRKHK